MTEAHVLPLDPLDRKSHPMVSGLLDYFPGALAEVAKVSKIGGDQHHPGQPIHWEREKSRDHADCLIRHLVDRGKRDKDGARHSAKVAWRALALLQEELEADGATPGRASVFKETNERRTLPKLPEGESLDSKDSTVRDVSQKVFAPTPHAHGSGLCWSDNCKAGNIRGANGQGCVSQDDRGLAKDRF